MTRPTVCLLLSVLAACGRDASTAFSRPLYDTLPGGIVRVRNTGPTRWSDTNGWKLVLERTIAPTDSSAGQLVQPSALVVDSRGTMYVLDQKPAGIKVFAPDGTFRRVIGREGSGPGEFRPWGLLALSRDTLIHHDPAQSRTTTFLADGTFLKVWLTKCCLQRPLAADDSGRMPVPGSITVDTTDRKPGFFAGAGFIRYRLDSTVVDTILFPKEPEQKLWTHPNGSAWFIPFGPKVSSILDRAGRYVWGYSAAYRFVISRTGLDTIRVFEAPIGAAPIPDSLRVARFNDALKNNDDLRAVAKLEDVPTTYPLWTSLAVDGANNIWVLLPGPKGEGSQWDVFSPDGVLLGRVPATFTSIWRTFWTRDRVYAIEDDDDGVTAIKVYRIAKDGVR